MAAAARRADASLDAGGHVGDLIVVAAGAEHDELDVAPIQSRRSQSAARGHVGELFHQDVGHAPFANARTADDPLIRGVEEAGEIGIGQDCRWQALSPTRDCRVTHGGAPGTERCLRIAGAAAASPLAPKLQPYTRSRATARLARHPIQPQLRAISQRHDGTRIASEALCSARRLTIDGAALVHPVIRDGLEAAGRLFSDLHSEVIYETQFADPVPGCTRGAVGLLEAAVDVAVEHPAERPIVDNRRRRRTLRRRRPPARRRLRTRPDDSAAG